MTTCITAAELAADVPSSFAIITTGVQMHLCIHYSAHISLQDRQSAFATRNNQQTHSLLHSLDLMLGGGLYTGELLEVVGESSVGKTQVACRLICSHSLKARSTTALHLDRRAPDGPPPLRGRVDQLRHAHASDQAA